jgi:hypothetical protein
LSFSQPQADQPACPISRPAPGRFLFSAGCCSSSVSFSYHPSHGFHSLISARFAASISPADSMLESLRLDDSMLDDGQPQAKRKYKLYEQPQLVHGEAQLSAHKRQRCCRTFTPEHFVYVKTLSGKVAKLRTPKLQQTRVRDLKLILEEVGIQNCCL